MPQSQTDSSRFKLAPAVRHRVPLLVGLSGPSSSGKTYSALRLAVGMQRVTGGSIACIDTESKRALHYADRFEFLHLPFDPPYNPLSYLAAIEHCVAAGAKVVIVDSFSHEHEGPGGELEMHDAYLDEKAGNDWTRREKLNFSARIKPKRERNQMRDGILRSGVNLIACFRAKPKLKLERGKDPEDRGFQPIGAEELIFEFTLSVLLYPGSGGVPTWRPEIRGEQQLIKLPEQFVPLFKEQRALDEAIGESLARWAAGDEVQPKEEGGDTTQGGTQTHQSKEQETPNQAKAATSPPSNDQLDDLIAEIYGAASRPKVAEIAAREATRPWSEEQRQHVRKAIKQRTTELQEREQA